MSADFALRAISYLTLICTREARHRKPNDGKSEAALKHVAAKWGQPVADFLANLGSDSASAVNWFHEKAPATPFGDYCRAVEYLFDHAGWPGGYGGKKWGNVTRCLRRYATGETSAEVMLDTVWTLVHNGGPIFNKGMQYHTYNGAALHDILNTQADGRVPERLRDGWKPVGVSDAAEDYLKRAVAALGEEVFVGVAAVSAAKPQPKGDDDDDEHIDPTAAEPAAPAASLGKFYLTPKLAVHKLPRGVQP